MEHAISPTLLAKANPVRVTDLLPWQIRPIIPAKGSARVTVTPRFGDPSLEVFSSAAQSVNDEAGLVASSRKAGSKKTERVTLHNRGSKQRSYYLAVKPQGSSRYQERRYLLRVRS